MRVSPADRKLFGLPILDPRRKAQGQNSIAHVQESGAFMCRPDSCRYNCVALWKMAGGRWVCQGRTAMTGRFWFREASVQGRTGLGRGNSKANSKRLTGGWKLLSLNSFSVSHSLSSGGKLTLAGTS